MFLKQICMFLKLNADQSNIYSCVQPVTNVNNSQRTLVLKIIRYTCQKSQFLIVKRRNIFTDEYYPSGYFPRTGTI